MNDWDWGDFGYDSWQSDYYINDWSEFPPAIQAILVGVFVIIGLICLTLLILQIVGMVKTFKKAKQPGWAAIVPFYNLFTIIKISGLELWWFAVSALALYSTQGNYWGWWWTAGFTSFAIFGAINYKVAQSFGKGLGFAVGMTLLPPIFWMILGCSNDIKYNGPAGPYKIKYPEAPKKTEK